MTVLELSRKLLAPAVLAFVAALPAQAQQTSEPQSGRRDHASRPGAHGELEATQRNVEQARQISDRWKPVDRSSTYRVPRSEWRERGASSTQM